MENIMVNKSKYVFKWFSRDNVPSGFWEFEKEILVKHKEIAQGKVSSLADVRKEIWL